MKKAAFLIFILSLFIGVAFAGDVSEFVNLGFSAEGNYFYFGQYGVTQEGHNPYGEVFMVDVSENRFLKDGVRKKVFPRSISLGGDGRGALFTLMEEMVPLRKKYGIQYLNQGRLIFIRVMEPSEANDSGETLNFKDFVTDDSYKVTLIQKREGAGAAEKASFHIQLELTRPGGSVLKKTVGLPNYYRSGVAGYRINRILKSPDGNSLVFIVEKMMAQDQGIRFMVETLDLR